MKPVVFLLGPTASGKTALACALRGQFPLDIVSVDSALVYRGMNVGTAKPDAATLALHPHRLIDLINPNGAYSAANFRRDALAAIDDSHAAGRVPLLVGGTMMYVKALLEGLSDMPPADAATRKIIEAKAAIIGWPAMHRELAAVDAITAARLSPNDSQRIQRALEVFALTGTPLSMLQTRTSKKQGFPFAPIVFVLQPSIRAVLHERISARFDAMLAAGLVDEVRSLLEHYPLTADMPSMRCVGYRQAWQFLDETIDAAALRAQGIAATRQLAKRQMTWLRSMRDVETFDCLDEQVSQRVAARLRQWLAEVD